MSSANFLHQVDGIAQRAFGLGDGVALHFQARCSVWMRVMRVSARRPERRPPGRRWAHHALARGQVPAGPPGWNGARLGCAGVVVHVGGTDAHEGGSCGEPWSGTLAAHGLDQVVKDVLRESGSSWPSLVGLLVLDQTRASSSRLTPETAVRSPSSWAAIFPTPGRQTARLRAVPTCPSGRRSRRPGSHRQTSSTSRRPSSGAGVACIALVPVAVAGQRIADDHRVPAAGLPLSVMTSPWGTAVS